MASVDFTALTTPAAHETDRVAAFARANGWQYFPAVPGQQLPGVVFREPDGEPRTSQVASWVVRMPGPPFFEVGNSAYMEVVQLGPFAVTWGYAAAQLPAPTPHVIVTVPGAADLPSLPPAQWRAAQPGAAPTQPGAAPAQPGGQNIPQVYAAPAAQPWALRVFTPQVLGLLAGPGVPLSVELREGWLFLYTPGKLSTTDPGMWQRVFTVRAALHAALSSAGAPAPAPAPAGAPAGEPADLAAALNTPMPVQKTTTGRIRKRRFGLIWVPAIVVAAGIVVVAIVTQLM